MGAHTMSTSGPVELHITPVDMVRQLLSEGVRPVHLVSDHPEKYAGIALPEHASVHHRDDIAVVFKRVCTKHFQMFAGISTHAVGVNVMIYDECLDAPTASR